MAVDKHDYVFVADSMNDRIRLLSPTLGFLGDIRIPGYVLSRPITLHFDEVNNRLYIGEDTGQRLFVVSADVAVTPRIIPDIRNYSAFNGVPGGKITAV